MMTIVTVPHPFTQHCNLSVDVCCLWTSKDGKCESYPCIQAKVSYTGADGNAYCGVMMYYDFESAEYQKNNASVGTL